MISHPQMASIYFARLVKDVYEHSAWVILSCPSIHGPSSNKNPNTAHLLMNAHA